jgi:hypothetical protein
MGGLSISDEPEQVGPLESWERLAQSLWTKQWPHQQDLEWYAFAEDIARMYRMLIAERQRLEELHDLLCEGGRVTRARWAKFVLHFRAEAIGKRQWPVLDFEQACALHKATLPWFHGFVDRQTAERRLQAGVAKDAAT